MRTISYPELNIEVQSAWQKDTLSDSVSFTAGGKNFLLENSLKYQPEGISTLSATLGIKKSAKPDFTVIKLDTPGPAAAVLTRSLCPSVTILRNREILKDGKLQAVVVNSGNANVYTPSGEQDVNETARLVAEEFNLAEKQILISSTGVIGVPLPMEKFRKGIPSLAKGLKHNSLELASEAILTTDLGPKTCSIKIGEMVLCGIAKGAGMIEPNLATMLVYFFTNLDLSPKELDAALREAANSSFNCLSIDSDTSTSDTVALLSTGAVPPTPELKTCFAQALRAMCVKLSRDICSQGEGVGKLIECCVRSSFPREFCLATAKLIINSPLFKSAVHGADPNWGRIVAAIGKGFSHYSGAVLDPEGIKISLCGSCVYDGGRAVETDLNALHLSMKQDPIIPVEVEIGGKENLARVWGADLTEEYVKFNSEYTS